METCQHLPGWTEERAFHLVEGKPAIQPAECTDDWQFCIVSLFEVIQSIFYLQEHFCCLTLRWVIVMQLQTLFVLHAGLGEVWERYWWITGETQSLQTTALSAAAWSPRGPSNWADALQGNSGSTYTTNKEAKDQNRFMGPSIRVTLVSGRFPNVNNTTLCVRHYQDLESTFDGWTGDLAHLTLLRESLSCYISAEDLSVLQERIELLHRQWDEICHQVLNTLTSAGSLKYTVHHLSGTRIYCGKSS